MSRSFVYARWDAIAPRASVSPGRCERRTLPRGLEFEGTDVFRPSESMSPSACNVCAGAGRRSRSFREVTYEAVCCPGSIALRGGIRFTPRGRLRSYDHSSCVRVRSVSVLVLV